MNLSKVDTKIALLSGMSPLRRYDRQYVCILLVACCFLLILCVLLTINIKLFILRKTFFSIILARSLSL